MESGVLNSDLMKSDNSVGRIEDRVSSISGLF
jgi:hypothetical protein